MDVLFYRKQFDYWTGNLSINISMQAFKKARSMGLGDLDFSAVYEIVKMQKD